MSVSSRLRNAVEALMGVSAFQPVEAPGPRITDAVVDEVREAQGGNIQPLPTTRLRWYLEDLDAAQMQADAGYLRMAAQLCASMRRDGMLNGLMKGRTKGLIRLPKRFYGNSEAADILKARNGTRSVFDEMFPPSELQLLDADGIELGIGCAEMVPVKGRDYPVMVRVEPEFLQYRWNENRWYFNSNAGSIPIEPGLGRWILHIPGGRLTPWRSGLWPALGRSFINKEHAIMYRSNFCSKLANPARVAYAPLGATEAQRVGFFKKVLAWGVNTVLEMPVGWEVKLLELTGGKTFEVFQKQIDTSDLEYMVSLAGQILTTKGGTGFDGQDVAQAIRQDLIQGDGDDLSYTINTQGIPPFIVNKWGPDALEKATVFEWDTGTPSDKEKETRVLAQAGTAIELLTKALGPYGRSVDIGEMTTRFGVPTAEGKVELPEEMRAEEAPNPKGAAPPKVA